MALAADLYEQAAAAAANEGMDPDQFIERALSRTLASRATERLQADSPWREMSEDEVMSMVVAEQRAARAERRGRAS